MGSKLRWALLSKSWIRPWGGWQLAEWLAKGHLEVKVFLMLKHFAFQIHFSIHRNFRTACNAITNSSSPCELPKMTKVVAADK